MKALDVVRNVCGKDFRHLEKKEKILKGMNRVFAKEVRRKTK